MERTAVQVVADGVDGDGVGIEGHPVLDGLLVRHAREFHRLAVHPDLHGPDPRLVDLGQRPDQLRADRVQHGRGVGRQPGEVDDGRLPVDGDDAAPLDPAERVADRTRREGGRGTVQQALDESRRLGLPGDEIAGIGDDALLGRVQEVGRHLVVQAGEVGLEDDQSVGRIGDAPLVLDELQGELAGVHTGLAHREDAALIDGAHRIGGHRHGSGLPGDRGVVGPEHRDRALVRP